MQGVIIIDKSEGISSFSAVAKVRRLFGVEKAGHTGTLDPMATGVLPVLIGRAVKASEFMLTSEKHYLATLRLGITTDTEDTSGKILTQTDIIPSEEEVLSAISSFVGDIMQTPPMYSALKVGGKKLYELAREGKEIKREARKVTVKSILAKKITERDYSLEVLCSKGTYIRTLCQDIGSSLGCGGAMSSLRRLEAGGFTLDGAHTLDELSAMSEEERRSLVIPTERIFDNKRSVMLPDFFSRLAHSGLEIYLQKIGASLEVGELVKMYDKDGFFALGEVRMFDDGPAVKPIRQF